MYKFITVLGITTLLFCAACERQEQQPTTRPGEPARTEQQREQQAPTPTTPTPGQTQEQAPGQPPGQTPGQAPGQAPAGEQR